MNRRRLPIGIQTFREVREDGCYYVDKTRHIRQLLQDGKHYFLSRPRRFGKSLFLDTLKELFEGSEGMFEGLAIHGEWDWSVRYPVIRLTFGSGHFTRPDGLHANVMAQLDALAEANAVESRYATSPEQFSYLIRALHERSERRVVVLVDEYDKPILDALEDSDLARANRDYLRGLYAVVKDCDAHVRFSFFTGVSKFSKVNLFSGLNNLTDLTLDPGYSTICGYTEADLDAVFAPELPGLDREAIRDWYNGYSWRGADKVYNPFDILLLFRSREFRAHWFETGSPTFLVDMLFRRRVRSVDLDGMLPSDDLLSTFDVDAIAPGGAAVPDRLSDDSRAGAARRPDVLPPWLSEPGGAARPQPQPPRPHGGRPVQTGGTQRAAIRPAGDGRFRRPTRLVPRVLREHSAPVVHQQRHRGVRRLLCQRFLLVLRGPRIGYHGGGEHEQRAAGHGRALRETGAYLRVQGSRAGRRRRGDGATRRASATLTNIVLPGVRIHLVAVEFSSASRNVVAFEVADG